MIKIILWNIAMTPSPPPHFGTRQAKERAPKIANILNKYDIVVLNESFIYRDELLSHTIHRYRYTDERIWYKPLNSGVVILSKIPLYNTYYKHYTYSSNWDWFTSKGLISVSFKDPTSGEEFELFGTHMQAGNRPIDHASRQKQANEIVRWVDNTPCYNKNIIICGDFNCGPVEDNTFEKFSVHYSSSEDAKLRNEQFNTIRYGTGSKQLTLPLQMNGIDEDISSFLYRGEYTGVRRILDPIEATGLSDTGPLCIVIE